MWKINVLSRSFTLLLLQVLLSSSKTTDTRHLQDDLVCPFDEERLYYKINICVEGTATNCNEYDLVGIGDLLQNLVNDIEAEIR
jgi:hypothetical protein